MADVVAAVGFTFTTVALERARERGHGRVLRHASENDNVGIIDWYGDTVGHDDWLVSDGQHLTTAGTEAYALLIRHSLCGM